MERPKKRNDCDYNLVYNLNDHVKNQDEYIEHLEAKLKTALSDRGAREILHDILPSLHANALYDTDFENLILKAMQEYAEQEGKEKTLCQDCFEEIEKGDNWCRHCGEVVV